jgi:hypothetical protein
MNRRLVFRESLVMIAFFGVLIGAMAHDVIRLELSGVIA